MTAIHTEARPGLSEERFEPVERIEGDPGNGLLLLCDHARNTLPRAYGRLGLPESEFARHIAYDIGARAVTLQLAEMLGAPAVLSCYSRLLIDPNRGFDDPTLIMRLSDGAVVPGNAAVNAEERARRVARYHAPYHRAIAQAIEEGIAAGRPPALVAIHSFTPRWKTRPRPWHIGILWDRDGRLATPFIEALRQEPDLIVGDNEPYSGQLKGDTLYTHGTTRGLAHALVEIRQDLIADEEGARAWADRLAPILDRLRGVEGINEIRRFGSHAD